jgi:hypothetical protein
MNLNKLYDILDDTTVPLRHGEVVSEKTKDGIHVVQIDAMPHKDDPEAADLHKVDMILLSVGVHMGRAQERKAELVEFLKSFDDQAMLAGGPSYIHMGAAIGDQGAAFRLFALGQALDLWRVVTPKAFGMQGEEAERAAGLGYVLITGWRPETSEAPKPEAPKPEAPAA